jgi:hypothetical protein
MTVTIEIKGTERVRAKLNDVQNRTYMMGAMVAATSLVKDWVAEYPAASEANQPRSFNSYYGLTSQRPMNRWYERGFGTRWARKNGSVGGTRTSETLGRSWTTRIEERGMRGVVGTKASYAPFVQDAEEQARFHAERGWRTVQDAVKEKKDAVVRIVQDAVHRIMAR